LDKRKSKDEKVRQEKSSDEEFIVYDDPAGKLNK